jgi:hypothetical protein
MIESGGTVSQIMNWFKIHHLNIVRDGFGWSGPKEDVTRAYGLLRDEHSGLASQLSLKVIPIPRSWEESDVRDRLKIGQGKGGKGAQVTFDNYCRCVIAPRDFDTTRLFDRSAKAAHPQDVFGCIGLCEAESDANSSRDLDMKKALLEMQ